MCASGKFGEFWFSNHQQFTYLENWNIAKVCGLSSSIETTSSCATLNTHVVECMFWAASPSTNIINSMFPLHFHSRRYVSADNHSDSDRWTTTLNKKTAYKSSSVSCPDQSQWCTTHPRTNTKLHRLASGCDVLNLMRCCYRTSNNRTNGAVLQALQLDTFHQK